MSFLTVVVSGTRMSHRSFAHDKCDRLVVTSWSGFENCEAHSEWTEGGEELGDQLVMSAMDAVR